MQARMSCLVVDLGSRDRGASFGRMEGGYLNCHTYGV